MMLKNGLTHVTVKKVRVAVRKNKKLIGHFKDEFRGEIMIKFVELSTKTYAYLMDDNTEKKQKEQKTV